MTPEQLRQIRGDRTREEFAAWLGGTSASTLNKWERNINPIPAWVKEKCLANVQVSLPLQDLQSLMDFSRTKGVSFESMLTDALRSYLHKHSDAPAKGNAILHGSFVAEPNRVASPAETEVIQISYSADELAQIEKSKRILKDRTDKAAGRRE